MHAFYETLGGPHAPWLPHAGGSPERSVTQDGPELRPKPQVGVVLSGNGLSSTISEIALVITKR